MKVHETQPAWVCRECGNNHKAGEWFEFSTWHVGRCGVCNEEKPVTEARDCGYLKSSWIKESKKCLNNK